MNRLSVTTAIAAFTLFFSTQAFAASDHSAHAPDAASGHGGHAMDKAHDGHGSGMKIHASSRDGYTFEYRFINMKDKVKKMKNMPQLKDPHHLMVFVKDSHGTAVDTAKVGYLIQEKGSGAVQKKMAMGMNKGFGADVTFEPGGHYTIKTKVMAGSKTLMDEFDYMGGDH